MVWHFETHIYFLLFWEAEEKKPLWHLYADFEAIARRLCAYFVIKRWKRLEYEDNDSRQKLLRTEGIVQHFGKYS